MKFNRMFGALLLTAVALAMPARAADPPELLNYQGVLRDSADDALDGTYDMAFDFYDAAGDASCNGSTLLLTDTHAAAGTGAVTVTDGLFNVAIGSGSVTPGTESGLAEVFRDNATAYLQVTIGAEKLCPRIRVLAAGYALNADNLAGKDSAYYLDTSGTTQEKTGLLVASGGVDYGPAGNDDLVAADVSALTGGGSADALHTHATAGSADTLDGLDSTQFLRSDTSDSFSSGTLGFNAGTVLDVNGRLELDGQLYMDYDGPDGDQQYLYFYDGGSPSGRWLRWDASNTRFQFNSEVLTLQPMTADLFQDSDNTTYYLDPSHITSGVLAGDLQLGQHLYAGKSVYVNSNGPDGDGYLHFYNNGSVADRYLRWDDANDRFTFNDDLNLPELTTTGHVAVGQNLYLNYDGPDGDVHLQFYNDGSRFGRRLMWDDSADRFQFDDDVVSLGELHATRFVDQQDSNYFLDPTGSGKMAGLFTTDGSLQTGQNVHINYNGPDEDSNLFFYNAGSASDRRLFWDDSADRFEFNDDLIVPNLRTWNHVYVRQNLYLNSAGPDGDSYLFFYDGGSPTGRSLSWRDTNGRFELNGDVYTVGGLIVPWLQDANDTNYWVNPANLDSAKFYGNVELGAGSGTDNDYLYFDQQAESLGWNHIDDEFTLSDDLKITGADIGVEATGASMGGYFLESAGSGYLYAAHQNRGARGFGNEMGLYASDLNDGTYTYVAGGTSGTFSNGAKNFVQNHPYDEALVVVYSALEGDEVGTYTRGTARLVAGEARVPLGESFQWVTNPDIGLTVHLTPVGAWSDLYVVEKSTHEIVVRSDGGDPEAVFDYAVYGLRIGFEEASVVREKEENSYIPSMSGQRALYERRPELRPFNALERFKLMNVTSALVAGEESFDFSRAKELKNAIEEFDPAIHGSPGARGPRLEGAEGGVDAGTGEAQATGGVGPEGSPSFVVGPTAARGGTVPGALPIDDQGNVYARSFRPSASDMASLVSVAAPVGAGDVLVIDARQAGVMSLARQAADTAVFGIVAGDPGVVLGAQPPPEPASSDGEDAGEDGEDAPVHEEVVVPQAPVQVPVVLSGVALCKVDAGYGSILPGDLLTTSSTAGHAMRADDPRPGTILGKALESLDTGTGLIRVLVMLR